MFSYSGNQISEQREVELSEVNRNVEYQLNISNFCKSLVRRIQINYYKNIYLSTNIVGGNIRVGFDFNLFIRLSCPIEEDNFYINLASSNVNTLPISNSRILIPRGQNTHQIVLKGQPPCNVVNVTATALGHNMGNLRLNFIDAPTILRVSTNSVSPCTSTRIEIYGECFAQSPNRNEVLVFSPQFSPYLQLNASESGEANHIFVTLPPINADCEIAVMSNGYGSNRIRLFVPTIEPQITEFSVNIIQFNFYPCADVTITSLIRVLNTKKISIHMNTNLSTPLLSESINQCQSIPLTRNLTFRAEENVRLTLRAFYFGNQDRYIERVIDLIPRQVFKANQLIIQQTRAGDILTVWVRKYRIRQILGNTIEEIIETTRLSDLSYLENRTIQLDDCVYYKYYIISRQFLIYNGGQANFAYDSNILSYQQYWLLSNDYPEPTVSRLLGKREYPPQYIR